MADDQIQTLRQRLQSETHAAMRAKDKDRIAVLRLVQAAMKQQEIDRRPSLAIDADATLGDPQILELLDKMIRQRRDAIEQFTQAKRQDLVDKESYEVKVIQEVLPAPLSDAAIHRLMA